MRLVLSAILFFAFIGAAFAKPSHAQAFDRHAVDGRNYTADGGTVLTVARHIRPSHKSRQKRDRIPTRFADGGIVTVQSAAGPITVAASFAPKITGFIADVVARGFKGGVHCYARGGHVRGSLHYRGEACDFAQRGWGKTVQPMYNVADLAAKHGLRDGCTFRDCGHIDSGGQLAARKQRNRYASN